MSMPVKGWRKRVSHMRYLLRCGGLGGLSLNLALRGLGQLVGLRLYRLALLPTGALSPLPPRGRYRFAVLRAQDMLAWAGEEMDLDLDFLAGAQQRGDVCHAVFDQDQLVQYCWCAQAACPVEPGLLSRYPQGYAYRYKEFTRPSHRGRQLGLFNCSQALSQLQVQGIAGLAKFVEADNLISQHVQRRKRYRFVGWAAVQGRWPNLRVWHSPGALRHGVGLRGGARFVPASIAGAST